jgi:hypothetical protein
MLEINAAACIAKPRSIATAMCIASRTASLPAGVALDVLSTFSRGIMIRLIDRGSIRSIWVSRVHPRVSQAALRQPMRANESGLDIGWNTHAGVVGQGSKFDLLGAHRPIDQELRLCRA